MSVGASTTRRSPNDGVTAVVEVDIRGRRDALRLYELLAPFTSFLIQHTTDRWVVHASAPGFRGETLAQALRAIDEWCAERRLEPPVREPARGRVGRSNDPCHYRARVLAVAAAEHPPAFHP